MSAKKTSSPFRRGRRTTAKKRRRRPKKRYRATTNSTEGTKNLKQQARKRSRSIGRMQKRAQQGHARRRQGAWPDIRPEQKTIPKKKRKKKIRRGIASSQIRTLSGEVADGKKKSWRGHGFKNRGPRRFPTADLGRLIGDVRQNKFLDSVIIPRQWNNQENINTWVTHQGKSQGGGCASN